MKIRRISEVLKEKYGQKIYVLALSSGCTCPNRDGKIASGGCTFCSAGGSGDFAAPFLPIEEQIRQARAKVDKKIPASIPPDKRKYIAYFQSFTNTYGDVARLEKLYTEAITRDEIVGLSLGTRPDCLGEDVMAMLSRLSRIKPVQIELGLQTANDKTAERIRRGYPTHVFDESFRKLKEAGISVVVHVILGLPGETKEDMLETIRHLGSLGPAPDGIKIQLLHILKGTRLAEEYEREPFPVFTMEEYCRTVVDCLKLLPEETVVHRMTGDGPRSLLIAPLWSTDKKRVLNTLNRYIEEA